MSNNKLQITNSGFTLIEAVVATAVFAFIVSSVIGVYISTFQLDRKTRAQRAVAQNGRFIMDFLAKEIRNGVIYYPNCPCGVPANPGLAVENQANEVEQFLLNGTNMQIIKNGSTANMNSVAVKVTSLKFFVSPLGDPYTPLKTYNEQPHVTVVLELTSNYSNNPIDVAKLNFQSTFATRNYPTRQ